MSQFHYTRADQVLDPTYLRQGVVPLSPQMYLKACIYYSSSLRNMQPKCAQISGFTLKNLFSASFVVYISPYVLPIRIITNLPIYNVFISLRHHPKNLIIQMHHQILKLFS